MTLKKLLEKHSLNDTIITVFANYKYRLVLENWLFAINNMKIKSYLVISLDEQIFKYLKDRNIQSYYYKTGKSLNDFWLTKIYILKNILDIGYTFIHSDADAVWLKNPLNAYFYKLPSDIIFTQGTIWPQDVHKKWGFVLCTGLFCVRSNENTGNFLNDVYNSFFHETDNTKDDQMSFNRVIGRDGVKWNIDGNYELTFKGKKFVCFDKIIHGMTSKYSIALLPHALFQRINEEKEPVYVKHLVSAKTSTAVIDRLKQNDLFFINENIG